MKGKARALLVVLVVFGGLVGAGWLAFDQALHLREDTVTTGSMEPEFIPGSRVFIREGQTPHTNDVIAFHNPSTGGVTVHIFGGYNADGSLKTKGMANEDPDDFAPTPPHQQDIIGVVIYHTEILTRAYGFSYRGLGVILVFVSAATLGMLARRMGRAERKEKNTSDEEVVRSASTPV